MNTAAFITAVPSSAATRAAVRNVPTATAQRTCSTVTSTSQAGDRSCTFVSGPTASLLSQSTSFFSRSIVWARTAFPERAPAEQFHVECETATAVAVQQQQITLEQMEANAVELKKFLQDAVGFDRSEATQIIEKYWRLKKITVEDRAQPAIDFLRGKGFSPEDIRSMVQRYPMLLSFSVDRRIQPVFEKLVSENLDPLVVLRRYPAVLDVSLDDSGITGRVRALQKVGVRGSAVLSSSPKVLRLDAQEKLRPVLEFLSAIGFTAADLEDIVQRRPWIFKRDLNRKLRPVAEFLRTLGLSDTELTQVLVKAPQLFGFGVDTLRSKVRLLINIGLKDDDVKNIVVKVPFVLMYDMHTSLKPKILFLETAGISGDDLLKVLRAVPSFWGMGLEDEIAPKFDYVLNVMGKSLSDILEDPATFFYANLKHTLVPRHQFLVQRDRDRDVDLTKMLKSTDSKFARELADASPADYTEFKKTFRMPLLLPALSATS